MALQVNGQELRAKIAELGISEPEFAAKVGVTQATVSRWITNKTSIRAKNAREVMAQLSNVNPRYLKLFKHKGV